MIYETKFGLLSTAVQPFICFFNSELPKFPVAFSADLRNVVLPGCAARTTAKINDPNPEVSTVRRTEFQPLELSLHKEWQRQIPRKIDVKSFYDQYAIQVSDSGEYLLTLHVATKMVEISPKHAFKMRLVKVYRDVRSRSCPKPDYSYVATIFFNEMSMGTTEIEGTAEEFVAIHPHLPIIAFTHGGTIVNSIGKVMAIRQGAALWHFLPPGEQLREPSPSAGNVANKIIRIKSQLDSSVGSESSGSRWTADTFTETHQRGQQLKTAT